METEQGAHSTGSNCTDCLTTLLLEATAITENIPTTQPKKPLPKFRLSQMNNELSYASVAAMAAKPGMQLTARPNRKGDLIIYSKDIETPRLLQEDPTLTLLDPAFIKKKTVITKYHVSMPLSIAASCNNIGCAVCGTSKYNVLVRRLIATFIVPVPSKLDLEVWGTFPIEEYTPELLRCYRCQRFGHDKEECRGPIICGVCSQRHWTEVCIEVHKEGRHTTSKCPNFSRPHHAWNKCCPECLKKIAAMKNTFSLNQKKPAPMQPPKDQRTPLQRRPHQPATAPASAPATAPNKDRQRPIDILLWAVQRLEPVSCYRHGNLDQTRLERADSTATHADFNINVLQLLSLSVPFKVKFSLRSP
ncbi:uncharacterized protein [Palaemon carinicauda]|uniref:uncharacterized protein n=1 Tax=Palaemon carinicauda TaxID=392227 RepID=UPI0035B5C6D0